MGVLLLPSFSNHCLANAIEPLRAANEFLERSFYDWTFLTLDGGQVASSSGLPVLPAMSLRDHPGGAYLFVLASYDVQTLTSAETQRALRAARGRFRMVVAMDTGPWLLADAGLLRDAQATIHPNELVAFSEAFPDVDVVADRFVRDGNVMTCGGAMAAFDAVLDLLMQTHGVALGLDVSAFFLNDRNTPDPGFRPRKGVPPAVAESLVLMRQNIEVPLSISDIATAQGLSQRTLGRHFRASLGASPQTVYQRLRLGVARDLIRRGSMSIAEVAVRSGYCDASAFARAYKAAYGVQPSQSN